MLTHRQSFEDAGDYNLVAGVDGAWRATKLLIDGFIQASMTGADAADPAVATAALEPATRPTSRAPLAP